MCMRIKVGLHIVENQVVENDYIFQLRFIKQIDYQQIYELSYVLMTDEILSLVALSQGLLLVI